VAGIELAEVDAFGVDDDPPVPILRGHVGEGEAEHRAAGRYGVEVDVAVQVPHQQVGVVVIVAELRHPAQAPLPERLDDGPELFAGRGEGVGDLPALVVPLDDAGPDQGLEPRRQQRRRHPGYAAAQGVEVPAAAEELTDHEHGPALVEQLHGLGHRAELSVSRHRGLPP
jgi:hypothetical protein